MRPTAAVRSLRAKVVIVAGNKVNELKIIIFVLNYLTVLVYTKTFVHLSVGGWLVVGINVASNAASENSHHQPPPLR